MAASPSLADAIDDRQLTLAAELIKSASHETLELFGRNRYTALEIAARAGYRGIVRKLIAAGANVHAPSDALVIAAEYGYANIVGQLINAGADANSLDHDGCSALMHASFEGHCDVVEKLLAAPGIDVNLLPPAENNTALIWAVWARKTKVIGQLLAAPGIDVNIRGGCEHTALLRVMQHAKKDENSDIVKQFLDVDADANIPYKNGDTLLTLAVEKGATETVRHLLTGEADINAQNAYGWTAAICAVCYEHAHILKELIIAGADLNLKDKRGKTVWRWAEKARPRNATFLNILYEMQKKREREQEQKRSQCALPPLKKQCV